MSQRIILTPQTRPRAMAAVAETPDGYAVRIEEQRRGDDQSDRFHALCGDLALSGLPWAGKPRKRDEWKVLLISGHAVATKIGAEMIPGLENEFVNIRESSARMGVKRMASLIEYAEEFCARNQVPRHDPRLAEYQ